MEKSDIVLGLTQAILIAKPSLLPDGKEEEAAYAMFLRVMKHLPSRAEVFAEVGKHMRP